MKVRADVHQQISRDEILRRVHQRLRSADELSAVPNGLVDLFAYPPDSRYVVSSKDILAALADLGRSPKNLVCAGYEFTQEARDCIHQQGGTAFSLDSSFGWTDESWRSVHQTRAT